MPEGTQYLLRLHDEAQLGRQMLPGPEKMEPVRLGWVGFKAWMEVMDRKLLRHEVLALVLVDDSYLNPGDWPEKPKTEGEDA